MFTLHRQTSRFCVSWDRPHSHLGLPPRVRPANRVCRHECSDPAHGLIHMTTRVASLCSASVNQGMLIRPRWLLNFQVSTFNTAKTNGEILTDPRTQTRHGHTGRTSQNGRRPARRGDGPRPRPGSKSPKLYQRTGYACGRVGHDQSVRRRSAHSPTHDTRATRPSHLSPDGTDGRGFVSMIPTMARHCCIDITK